MDIVTKVAAAMQSALGPALDQLGRQAGVIRRQRKFTGASLFRTIVLTLMRAPSPRTDHFVSTAAMLHLGVTGRAIEKRFDERLVTFLRRGLERTIEHALAADPARVALLEKFTAVEIQDSTSITLPDIYADQFPGRGGKSGSGKSAVKIQLAYDLRSGRVGKLEFQPGRDSELSGEDPDAPVRPGSLLIRDLGYFSLPRFRRWGRGGAYWISRWQPGTSVSTADGGPLDLLEYARGQGESPIDVPVLLGAAERLPCRLIVVRVPPGIAARRRRKAHERGRKHGTVPSRRQLAMCDWTIFLTNCPQGLLTWKGVVVLYRARWQIELMFKLWKSHNHLAASRGAWTAVERMAMFWAKLVVVILQHWLLLTSAWSDVRRSHWKAAGEVRRWVAALIRVIDDADPLVALLKDMARAIEGIANKKLRKKSPSLFQLLENPELLDWGR